MVPAHEDPDVHTMLRGEPAAQLRWLRGRGLPDATLLAVHNPCAQRCFFCAGAGTTSVAPGDVTTLDAALRQLTLRPPEVERLLIGGNEPTLHPGFERITRAVRLTGFQSFELMTSGTTLAGGASRWAGRGLVEVVVPLYGVSADTHDRVVGARSFEQVVKGLDAALAAGVRVRVHTLLLRDTLHELSALSELVVARWGTRLGVGLLRDKNRFDFEASAPAFSAMVEAIVAIPERSRPLGLLTPRCLPTVHEAAPLLTELYFRTQLRRFGPACRGCALREGCDGAVVVWADRVRPPGVDVKAAGAGGRV